IDAHHRNSSAKHNVHGQYFVPPQRKSDRRVFLNTHLRCSIPLCEREATRAWDTLHSVSAPAGTLGAVPICDFHLWLLGQGANITVSSHGLDAII
ncbi:MAG: hypothetical protein ACTILK_00965, partial [Bifidobacterium crudilactis]|uniref:hypothetical protein n=1 Tax=Bifidobacterium crudilactis TaxID=327277 RepID=UPI003F98D913